MHYIFFQQYRWIPVVSSEHEETRSRVCILSAGIRTSIETKNKLIGWVDSDFESDPDTRKSMTGYFIRVSEWRSIFVWFLEDVTIPKKSASIWEDSSSCIMMSKNPTNRDRGAYRKDRNQHNRG
jgi:hypothetical protein